MNREHAWRVFAEEFNDSSVELKEAGEMKPSYVLTPLGGKMNRVYLVGVLTDVEEIPGENQFVRAHISDPTGVFTLFSGQYQPEVTNQLLTIEVPAFIAVVGKTRSYAPEDGDRVFVSIRPEGIFEVTADARDAWILETCKQTKQRIDAIREALQMAEPTEKELMNLGFNAALSSGVVAALKEYDTPEMEKYLLMIKEAIHYVVNGPGLMESPKEASLEDITEAPSKKSTPSSKEAKKDPYEEAEKIVLQVIKENEGDEGSSWDVITEECAVSGLDADTVEEVLNALMDKGLIYEPVLGTIKTT